jgi:hypothetical protein
MTDWLTRCRHALQQGGQVTHTWSAGDGRLMIVPFAGRVLGCTLPNVEGNLFYHDARMEDPAQAVKALPGPGGGDRLWIAPEVAYMWPDLARARVDPFSCYVLPPQMDPAGYRTLDQREGHIALAATMRLTDHRLKKSVTLEVNRRVDVIDRPENLPHELEVASFALSNSLSVIEGDDGAVAGAWDLLQLPVTGTLICPTLVPVGDPRSYYDPFDLRHVHHDETSVCFLVDAQRRIKMGLSAAQTTGRMAYHREVGRMHTLIVRIFHPQPGEPYVDLPRASDQILGGDVLQAYNDNGSTGPFGEMEYHDPAIVVGKTAPIRANSSVTHVMAGPLRAIQQAFHQLLGIPLPVGA